MYNHVGVITDNDSVDSTVMTYFKLYANNGQFDFFIKRFAKTSRINFEYLASIIRSENFFASKEAYALGIGDDVELDDIFANRFRDYVQEIKDNDDTVQCALGSFDISSDLCKCAMFSGNDINRLLAIGLMDTKNNIAYFIPVSNKEDIFKE
jgi:hypothetical protein